jgi:hypothetical protein
MHFKLSIMHDYQLFIGTTNIDTTSTDSATHMSGMRIQACASLCDSVVEDATHLCLLLAQLLPLACLLLTLIGCGTLIECEDCRLFTPAVPICVQLAICAVRRNVVRDLCDEHGKSESA